MNDDGRLRVVLYTPPLILLLKAKRARRSPRDCMYVVYHQQCLILNYFAIFATGRKKDNHEAEAAVLREPVIDDALGSRRGEY